MTLGQALPFLCRFGEREAVHASAWFDPDQQFCVVIHDVSAIVLRRLVRVPSSWELAPRGRRRPWHTTTMPFSLDQQTRRKEITRESKRSRRAYPLTNGCSPTPLSHTQPPAFPYETSRPYYTLAAGRKISASRGSHRGKLSPLSSGSPTRVIPESNTQPRRRRSRPSF